MKKLAMICTAAVACATLGTPSARAEWRDLDGPLNDNEAYASSFAVHAGTPVAAMSDADGSGNGAIHVKIHDGSAWLDVGENPISVTGTYESASAPSIALGGDGTPYVAWHHDHNDTPETRQIFVKTYDGEDWVPVGTHPLNDEAFHAASAPCIVLDASDTPYVAWHEEDALGTTRIFVKMHDGEDWVPVGTNPLNEVAAHNARLPCIVLDGDGNPYVTWQEEDGSEPPVYQVFVKRLTPGEGDWTLVGTDNPLNRDAASNALAPRIAFNGTVPHVTWSEQNPAHDLAPHVYVKSYDGVLEEWAFVGGEPSLNVSADQGAYEPDIAFDEDGNPFVVWYEGTAAFEDVVYAKKFYDGAGWGLVARLNMGDDRLAEAPRILFDDVDGLPYIEWLEENEGFAWQVLVAQSTPTFVAMKSLTPEPCEDDICIRVAWETDMEPENAGFHVWRRIDLPGQEEYERITDALIPAQGTQSTGAPYEWLDPDVVTGQVYDYKVEDVSVDSESTFHGPESAMGPMVLVPDWEPASTVHDPAAGASDPVNALALLVVPCGALLLAGIRFRRAR